MKYNLIIKIVILILTLNNFPKNVTLIHSPAYSLIDL